MKRFLFEYRYSDGEWTLTGFDVIESSNLESACAEFETYNSGKVLDYEVFEVGQKLR